MIRWRLVILAVLVAAALAGGFTYFVTSPPRVEAEQRLTPTPTPPGVTGSAAGTPTKIGEHRSAEDFQRAAEAILKRLPDVQASARTDELPIIEHIPLPKRRPIPR
jgi:hypothetical protein